jgi:type IV pilus assembly protein PilC
MATATNKEMFFLWEGKDKTGKLVKGELAGKSDALIKAQLRRQRINPLKVKKKPKSLMGGGSAKISPKDITIFSRQLATMMSAGVPLVQAFEIVGRGHENPGMQDLILGVKADVEAGNSLTEALKKKPSMISIVIWLRQVSTQVSWKLFCTNSQCTWRKQKHLNLRLRLRCFIPLL